MKAYWAVVNARFRMLLQYRAAALAGFGTQLFFGLVRVMIFDAFYRSSTAPQPMGYAQTITYLWLIQALLRILPWSVDTDWRAMIRDGTVAYELLRPVDLFNYWYSRSLALVSAPMILRCPPLVALAIPFLGMQLPPSWQAAAMFFLAVMGAVFLSAAITTLLQLSLMWTLTGEGILRLISASSTIFSGAIIPIPFFPDWAQTILYALPFRGLMDTPFRLYTGHISAAQAWPHLVHQWAWTLALVGLGRWLLARGTRRLVVQGG